MERIGEEPATHTTPVLLRPPEEVGARLEKLNALPSVRRRIFPQLLELAGQEVRLEDLAGRLAAIIRDYSLSKPESMRRSVALQRINELPLYLKILIPESQEAVELLSEGTLQLLAEELLRAEERQESDSPVELRTGAPRGIKKILAIPEELRTDAQKKDLDSWARRFGKQVTGQHPEKQPAPRKLAELQAERERQRGVE